MYCLVKYIKEDDRYRLFKVKYIVSMKDIPLYINDNNRHIRNIAKELLDGKDKIS